MPKKAKIGDEDVDLVTVEDLNNIGKQLSAGFEKLRSEIKTAKTEAAQTQPDYCPECGVYTRDLFQHLKMEPEKHGLVKTVEVVKEAQSKPKRHETVEEYLNCPDCYPKFEKAMLENPKFQEKLKQEGWRKERR